MNQTVKIMTPGPTQVRENVRMARSFVTTNPDLDLTFYEEYKAICDRLSTLLHTNNASYILSGEGILGLEAACASLTAQRRRANGKRVSRSCQAPRQGARL